MTQNKQKYKFINLFFNDCSTIDTSKRIVCCMHEHIRLDGCVKCSEKTTVRRENESYIHWLYPNASVGKNAKHKTTPNEQMQTAHKYT